MAVDLSKYLQYIRYQGGEGCWGYSMLAMWDILNEMHCPNSPNLSMNLWLMLHREREQWSAKWWQDNCTKPLHYNGKFQTPDGRLHQFETGPEYGLFQTFGITTEGTEPHIGSTRWTGGFTEEGINEAANYRLVASDPDRLNPQSIEISAQSFRQQLDQSYPIRLSAGKHFVAIVGYDEKQKIFKFIDSGGDRAHQNGFGTFTFGEIDSKKTNWLGVVASAEIIRIIPPRPVPIVRIGVRHALSRQNINLWLSAEGSPKPKKKIWTAWELPEDNSSGLDFKVRVPSEFIWSPSPKNRLLIDLYDSGAIPLLVNGNQVPSGGEIFELYAAFGNHVIQCTELREKGGVIKFKTGEHKVLTIP